MSRIDGIYTNACLPDYGITVSDPYATTCIKYPPQDFSPPEFISYDNYLKIKNKAFFDVNYEFINKSRIDPEKKYEGFIVAWLLQREVGYEDRETFTLQNERISLSDIIDRALTFFINPDRAMKYSKAILKRNYWQIRLALILLENVDLAKTKSFLKKYEAFFNFNYSFNSKKTRKEMIYDLLQILHKKAEAFGDPILLSEINFKIGILLNEQSKYAEAKKKFNEANQLAQSILDDPDKYFTQHIANRVENVENDASGTLITNYYQIAERYRVISNAKKMLAQTMLLTPRPDEIPIPELQKALKYVEEAEAYLNEPKDGYINRDRSHPKNTIYKYFAEIYGMLDLERMRADILARMALLLKEPCRDQSQKYLDQANQILERITKWRKDFESDRREKAAGRALELHPLAEGNGVSIFSEWGADIIGNTYLAKARLLMATYSPPNDPKANLRLSKPLLDEAQKFLVKKDDYNFKSALAEYLVRMHIEASPKRLSREVKDGKDILETLPPGFIYSLLWLPRIYIKEEQFELAQKFLKGILDSPAYKAILTPQLMSSILQIQAELALEDEDTLGAKELFTKSICWYPYNFYTQIGLGDLTNWRGRFADARDNFYQRIMDDPRLPINVKKRVELGIKETYLREITINPGNDPTKEADDVIALSKEILEKSDELFMLERALESRGEAFIAKKEDGEDGLIALRDKLLKQNFDIEKYLGKSITLKNPEIRERVKANLFLAVADGFLFIHHYEKEAPEVIRDFEKWLSIKPFTGIFSPKAFEDWFEKEVESKELFKKRPVLMAHYLLTSAEISQRANPYDEIAIKKIEKAAAKIFSLPSEKKDPYLSMRVIKDLIDIYVNKDEFEMALALLFTTIYNEGAKEKLFALSGILSTSIFEPALKAASELLRGVNVKSIFANKGLVDRDLKSLDRWKHFYTDLRLKGAEVSTWTKNYENATAVLNQVENDLNFLPPKQKKGLGLWYTRIRLAHGNIASQWRKNLDFEKAYQQYAIAEDMLNNLNDKNPGQELILVKTELFVNQANIFRYGRSVKDLDKSLTYYSKAEAAAAGTDGGVGIKGNDDLKYYHLARVDLGYAKIAEERKHLTLNGINYWPDELLAMAFEHKDKIIRQYKYAVNQMISELQINHQNLARDYTNPNVSFEAHSTTDYQGKQELRFKTQVTESIHLHPFPKLNLAADFILNANRDIDQTSDASIQNYYVGGRIRPTYWLTASAGARVRTELITDGNLKLKYLKNPDLSLALDISAPGDDPFIRGLSATFVTDQFLKAPSSKLNSYYGNVFYSFARDAKYPVLQSLAFGAQANYFRFPYEGNLPERLKFNVPTIKWGVDFKELDTFDFDPLKCDMLKLGIEASLVYEKGIDFSRDGKTSFEKHNLGFSTEANLALNLFYFKLYLYYRYEGMSQDIERKYQLKDRWLDTRQFGGTLEARF